MSFIALVDKKNTLLSTGYEIASSSVDTIAGIGTLQSMQVVGLQRAGPSATLDKVMKLLYIIAVKVPLVKKNSIPQGMEWQ